MSSRQNRADRSVLGPEDFMDEEVGQAMTRVSLVVVPSLCPESAVEAFLLVLRFSLVDVCGAVSSAPVTSPSLKSCLC